MFDGLRIVGNVRATERCRVQDYSVGKEQAVVRYQVMKGGAVPLYLYKANFVERREEMSWDWIVTDARLEGVCKVWVARHGVWTNQSVKATSFLILMLDDELPRCTSLCPAG